MTWTRRKGRAPRGCSYSGKPLTRLRITFNLPQPGGMRMASRYAGRRWDTSDPKLTGELLLAVLKENA